MDDILSLLDMRIIVFFLTILSSANRTTETLKLMKVYVGEPLKFSSSSLVRKLREEFLERSSHFGVNLFFI